MNHLKLLVAPLLMAMAVTMLATPAMAKTTKVHHHWTKAQLAAWRAKHPHKMHVRTPHKHVHHKK